MSQLEMQRPTESRPAASQTRRTSRMAIWALVLAIVNLGGVGSVLGVVLGAKARGRISETGEGGAGLAIAAMIVGVLTFIGAVVYWIVIAQHFGGSGGGGGTGGGY